jgi:hypothetical protein
MKIKIGPYVNCIGPYQIAEKLCFWAKGEGYNSLGTPKWVYNFGTWLAEDKNGNDSLLTKVCQWIHDKRNRKIKIQIDNYDVWSMDNTLAMIILPMLKKLKENKQGSAIVDLEDVPEELRGTSTEDYENQMTFDWYKSEEELHPNIHDRWDWVLNEMIWTFEQLNDDNNEEQFHSGVPELLWQALDVDKNPIGEPMRFKDKRKNKNENITAYTLVKGPNNTAVYDAKGHRAHDERIQRGLVLFGKYFRGLWD